MESTVTLKVMGIEIQFREPGLREWNMYLSMQKTDEVSATTNFLNVCCTSHEPKQLQEIFEKKPLAVNKAFNMIFALMQEGIEEKK